MAETPSTSEFGHLVVPDRIDSMQSTKTFFSERDGWDDPDWLRAWPFGPVHFSLDWSTRTDGRFDTVCGKSPMYWPELGWPAKEVCPDCKAWVKEHGSGASPPLKYERANVRTPPAGGEG